MIPTGRHFGLAWKLFARGLVLIAIIAPATVLPNVPLKLRAESSEAELPFEQCDEQSLVAAVNRQRRECQRTVVLPCPRCRPPHALGRCFDVALRPSGTDDGHRLTNGLLAPLIC